MSDQIVVRSENEHDREAVHAVNVAAFPALAEAELVDALRAEAEPYISLVAEEAGAVVGHIMYSPVTLDGHPELRLMGLAPMAVRPEYQRKGIGSMLVRAGLKACEQLSIEALVVLGHPAYYPRFGFIPSARFGIDSEYGLPEEAFMAQELRPGVLTGKTGRIRYHEAFGRF